jgi:hypothetical protein
MIVGACQRPLPATAMSTIRQASAQPHFAARAAVPNPIDSVEHRVQPLEYMSGEDETGSLSEILSNEEAWKNFQGKCLNNFTYSYGPPVPSGGIDAAVLVSKNWVNSYTTPDKAIQWISPGYNNLLNVLGIKDKWPIPAERLKDVGIVFFLLPAGQRFRRVTEPADRSLLLFEVGNDPRQTKASWHLMAFPINKMNGDGGGSCGSREYGATRVSYVSQGGH